MTATTENATTTRSTTPARSLLRTGLVATVAAAAATEALTGIVRAAGVHLAVGSIGGSAKDVVEIGPGACTIMVAICMVLGLALAGLLNRYAKAPAHTWVVTTGVLTVLSFVPDVFAGATSTSTKVTLIAAHVVAAAIAIPLVARTLRPTR